MAERRNEATDGSLLMWAEYLVAAGQRQPRPRMAAMRSSAPSAIEK